ncbi:DUF4145 domain-containing protein [Methylorubrum sp. SB2]|uniref:DUF4145 domain-containing protein n=1 Tax=Methylorubrum subtropicum TaxID=3138812 RepID=UPI00313DBE05
MPNKPTFIDFTDEDREAFISEIGQEVERGSDRAVVLLGAAMVDEVLKRTLRQFFADVSSTEELLEGGPSAPLGSFSARIKIAEALGLIAPAEAKIMDSIRTIRNDYAHRLAGEIDTAAVSDKLASRRATINKWIAEAKVSIAEEDNFGMAYAKMCISAILFLVKRFSWIDRIKRPTRPEMVLIKSKTTKNE